ncbi:hypothetical protein C4K46_09405 [Streptococcus oricebi]|uniref:Sensor histidine kinase NatK-like C-terminal domain-containing protein n=1 Tax=Streptococcus oricebi TaxID=1547447 RepID=A0ABS5B5R4_9STRE|nr:hypothetical protein [Streptococcus oricebi]
MDVALIASKDEVLFIVRNNRPALELDQRKIWERGYSSKGRNRGLGLSNLLELVHEFDNVSLNTEVGPDSFSQTLIFKPKGAY